jgi:hypothetical protein
VVSLGMGVFPYRLMEIIRPRHDGPFEQPFVSKEPFVWKVVCPVHGPYEVRQKTEPVSCKIKVQLSPRMVRECRKRLTSAVRIRQKKRGN